MSTEYVILQGRLHSGEIKTVLVEATSFKNEQLEPADYFVRPYSAKEVGRIQILGDDGKLDEIYTSE